MTVEDEIRSFSTDLEALRVQTGALHLLAYTYRPVSAAIEPVFVADLDASRAVGYTDRYFDLLFGLQSIFARPVDLVEAQMLPQVELRCGKLRPVSLEELRATA
ncbi:MAG: hypothetical protein ACRYFU_21645 [Janthinobacterium lividum]